MLLLQFSIQSSLEMGCLRNVFANPLKDLNTSEWKPTFCPDTRTSHIMKGIIDEVQHPSTKKPACITPTLRCISLPDSLHI